MTGTFGGALEARQIPAGEGYLSSESVGEVELDGSTLILRRVHITYHLKIDPGQRKVAERVLGFHAQGCPVYRSIGGCIQVTTDLEMENPAV